MKISEDRRKKLKIITMYYEQELTQAQIAKKMNISRPVVSKILQQAKEDGLITISIREESAYTARLAVQLEEKYDLQDVIIVPASSQSSLEKVKQTLSQAAAAYFVDQMQDGLSIGLSWGTSLADMIEEMPFLSMPNSKVCPLVGGVSSEHLSFDTNHLVFRLAERLNCQCHYFYAPALAESKKLADVLNQSKMLSKAMAAAKSVDVAIIGVGNTNKSSTWKKLGYFEGKALKTIKETGVKGDAVASLFDKSGKTVNNEISTRMLGIKVEELKQIPTVMVLAAGEEKTESLRALLRGGGCSVLVIDQLIAENLLKDKGRD